MKKLKDPFKQANKNKNYTRGVVRVVRHPHSFAGVVEKDSKSFNIEN
jgi:hypothetical protein